MLSQARGAFVRSVAMLASYAIFAWRGRRMTITKDELAGRIRHLREEAGLTQHDLAGRVASLDQPKISKIETCERGVSSLELAELAGP